MTRSEPATKRPPIWPAVSGQLQQRLTAREVSTYLQPLQVRESDGQLKLFAPNEIIADRLRTELLDDIKVLVSQISNGETQVALFIGRAESEADSPVQPPGSPVQSIGADDGPPVRSQLNPEYQFDSFVQGASNRLGLALAEQVAERPGKHNPLLMYGGTGLGKTHLLHAIGNAILARDPRAKIAYIHSEQFVNDMIAALRHKDIGTFKARYRSVTALLIDDIQFFAGKDRSQEELFHTFNSLLGNQQQVVLTCDRYPKEVKGLESRLSSRFGWGLVAAIEPPDFETRVAILINKADQNGVDLDQDVAFLLAERIRTNVRDLEGALNTLIATARYQQITITTGFARRTLRDLLSVHDKLVTVRRILSVVSAQHGLSVDDLLSRSRKQTIARPRMMAMYLAKELTNESLPAIGEAFGGRDHTTVIHAHRRIAGLREDDQSINDHVDRLHRLIVE